MSVQAFGWGGLLCAVALLLSRADLCQAQDPVVLPRQKGSIEYLAFSPDGKTLASTTVLGEDGIRLWDARIGKLLKELEGHPRQSGPLIFLDGGKTLLVAGADYSRRDRRDTAMLWDLQTGKTLRSFGIRDMACRRAALTPDGKTLILSGLYETASLYDLAAGKQLAVLEGPGQVWSMALSPDGKTLATGHPRGGLVWDLAAKKRLFSLEEHQHSIVQALAFSPDGKSLVSGDSRGVLVFWDLESGKKKYSWDLRRQRRFRAINGMAFSPDGKWLALAGDLGKVMLWDVERGEPCRDFRGARHDKTGSINCVAFSPDGKTLASGGDDKSIILWPVPPHKPRD